MFKDWTKLDDANPLLRPGDEVFRCPISNSHLKWREKDVFNPSAVRHGGRVALLFRAEDRVGPWAGTSRIGLAWSDDGRAFEVEREPVLFPADDRWREVEWAGGCEDPRVVAAPTTHQLPGMDRPGGFVMTYTAYDGERARLMVATSRDLRFWTKHGPALKPPYRDVWAKSGAVVTREHGGALVAERVGGRFWMYWGEGHIFAATSRDLVQWTVLEHEQPADRTFTPGVGNVVKPADPPLRVARPLVSPRRGGVDGYLCEPGPAAVRTADGITLIYNAASQTDGPIQPGTPERAVRYCPARVVFDAEAPEAVIARDVSPLFEPDRDYEVAGQVNAVCFAEGLVRDPLDASRWLLYYGTADSRIAAAASTSG